MWNTLQVNKQLAHTACSNCIQKYLLGQSAVQLTQAVVINFNIATNHVVTYS